MGSRGYVYTDSSSVVVNTNDDELAKYRAEVNRSKSDSELRKQVLDLAMRVHDLERQIKEMKNG